MSEKDRNLIATRLWGSSKQLFSVRKCRRDIFQRQCTVLGIAFGEAVEVGEAKKYTMVRKMTAAGCWKDLIMKSFLQCYIIQLIPESDYDKLANRWTNMNQWGGWWRLRIT